MMKKLSLFSVLLLLVSCGSVNVSSSEEIIVSSSEEVIVSSSEEVVKISTPEEFMAINTKSNVINYELVNDIDLAKVSVSIPSFYGVLNGNGYSIKNYFYTGDDEKDNVGLFSRNLGEINNLVIDGFDIYEKGSINNIGLLVGKNDGKVSGITVKNSTLKASLCGDVGGIVGRSTNTDIYHCSNNAVVQGNVSVGGVVGMIDVRHGIDKINDLTNNGEVSGDKYVGGVIGRIIGEYDSYENLALQASIKDLANSGNIIGKSETGGIIGQINGIRDINNFENCLDLSISSCSNTGDITGSSSVAGIIGSTNHVIQINHSSNGGKIKGLSYVGGISGRSQSELNLDDVNNIGDIEGRNNVGGIAGNANIVTNARNEGSLSLVGTIAGNAGGIAGVLNYSSHSINKGNISVYDSETGAASIGGIAGVARIEKGKNVTDNINEGNISANTNSSSKIGGIYGYCISDVASVVKNNENKGNIIGASSIGGIIGYLATYEADNFVSSNEEGFVTIQDNSNKGRIECNLNLVGGIIGSAAGIDNKTIIVKDNSNSGAITYGANKGQYTKDFGASIVGLINDYVNNMDPSYWETNNNTGTVYSYFTDSYIDRLYTSIK